MAAAAVRVMVAVQRAKMDILVPALEDYTAAAAEAGLRTSLPVSALVTEQ
jgi:hypothetical protein